MLDAIHRVVSYNPVARPGPSRAACGRGLEQSLPPGAERRSTRRLPVSQVLLTSHIAGRSPRMRTVPPRTSAGRPGRPGQLGRDEHLRARAPAQYTSRSTPRPGGCGATGAPYSLARHRPSGAPPRSKHMLEPLLVRDRRGILPTYVYLSNLLNRPFDAAPESGFYVVNGRRRIPFVK
jgi:hypothetical protein